MSLPSWAIFINVNNIVHHSFVNCGWFCNDKIVENIMLELLNFIKKNKYISFYEYMKFDSVKDYKSILDMNRFNYTSNVNCAFK